ncbi:MAG: hypothetical protein LBH25_01060 [Fibromonadaceae bacterium]|nr:hypothetical protein [Fibromonadaceae bacterium]
MKKPFLFFVLAFCAISNAAPICNGIEYNPLIRFCGTDNKIYDKCGGNNEYNISTHFCFINANSNSNVYEKCNNNKYDPATHGCCNKNALYALPTQFCGTDNKVYDKCPGEYNTSTHFCAADKKVYEKCNNNTYTPATHGCCNKSTLYALPTQFCSSGVYDKCGNANYDPAKQSCVNNKVENKSTSVKCGSIEYDTSTQFCVNNAVYEKCNNNTYTPATDFCHNGAIVKKVLGTFTDSRDKQTYKTVTIGTKTWMTENLRYRAGAALCYDACDKRGALYNWEKVYDLRAKKDIICPAGWHIPTDSDWNDLVNYAGGSSNAGKKLKARSGWDDNGNGTDDYDFSALPAGFLSKGGDNSIAFSYDLGKLGYWWGIVNNQPYRWSIGNGVSSTPWNVPHDGFFSVRCVKD